MEYLISAWTDIGTRKQTNQDSVSVKKLNTSNGEIVFAVLCDGMGGLANGELASAEVVAAFNDWVYRKLPQLYITGINEDEIIQQWNNIVQNMNAKIMNYAQSNGVNMGTTVVALLVTQSRYYLMNVGDSRAYELSDSVRRMTNDHTVVAQKVRMGKITEEEALRDPQRNVLLQCVGASDEVKPEFYFGESKVNACYMLCSDGLIHEVTAQELLSALSPAVLNSKDSITNNLRYITELVKSRGETDNISSALIRTK